MCERFNRTRRRVFVSGGPDGRRYRRSVRQGQAWTSSSTKPTEALPAGKARITKSLERGVSVGKVTEDASAPRHWPSEFHNSLADTVRSSAGHRGGHEDDGVKGTIFAEIDKLITDPTRAGVEHVQHSIMKIAARRSNPGRGSLDFSIGAGADSVPNWSARS